MSCKIETVFDGEVFRPETPVDLPPNTRATLTVEAGNRTDAPKDTTSDPYDFIQVTLSFHLESPPDFVENLDKYLYGNKSINFEAMGAEDLS